MAVRTAASFHRPKSHRPQASEMQHKSSYAAQYTTNKQIPCLESLTSLTSGQGPQAFPALIEPGALVVPVGQGLQVCRPLSFQNPAGHSSQRGQSLHSAADAAAHTFTGSKRRQQAAWHEMAQKQCCHLDGCDSVRSATAIFTYAYICAQVTALESFSCHSCRFGRLHTPVPKQP